MFLQIQLRQEILPNPFGKSNSTKRMASNSFRFFFYNDLRKDFSSKLQCYALLLLGFSIPLNNICINISAGLLMLGWLLKGNYLLTFKGILKSPFLLSLILLFLLYAAGLLYTENSKEGYFSLEKKYSLLIFPILIGANPKIFLSSDDLKRILLYFITSCFLVSAICLVRGIYFLIFEHTAEKLFYHALSEPFHLHAVYFSVYLACAVFFLLWLFERNFPEWNPLKKSAAIGLIIFFSLVIFMLSARTVIVSYMLLLVGNVFYIFYKHSKIKLAALIVVVLMTAAGFVVWKVSFIHERFAEIAASKWYFSPEENNANGFTLRLVKWSCSLQGMKENLLSGVGTGDVQDYLQACYKDRNFWGQVFQFNSHNQFLQTGLTIGIVGMFVLVYSLFAPLVSAYRKKKPAVFVFLLLIIFASMTESFLERQQGILFFCFFYSLLLREDVYSSAVQKE